MDAAHRVAVRKCTPTFSFVSAWQLPADDQHQHVHPSAFFSLSSPLQPSRSASRVAIADTSRDVALGPGQSRRFSCRCSDKRPDVLHTHRCRHHQSICHHCQWLQLLVPGQITTVSDSSMLLDSATSAYVSRITDSLSQIGLDLDTPHIGSSINAWISLDILHANQRQQLERASSSRSTTSPALPATAWLCVALWA